MAFAFIGRILAALTAFGLIICAAFTFNAVETVGLNIYAIFLGCFVMLIELPILCSCWLICEKTAHILKYVTGFWIARGIIYLGVSAGGYAIYAVKKVQNVYMIIVLVALSVAGLLFLVAAVRREPNPAYELLFAGKDKKAASATGSASTGAAKSSGGGFSSLFGSRAKKAAGDAAATAGAAVGAQMARSAAEEMFGSSKPASSGGATDLENPPPVVVAAKTEKEPSKASLFTGGGLFGGGNSKYGYSQDTPESNPFVNH